MMGSPAKRSHAFTLAELLIVIAVMAILLALLIPALSRSRTKAKRATCLNHLHQIALGVRMYADDANDTGPARFSAGKSLDGWMAYKQLMKSHLEQNSASSPEDKPFACPADTYHYDFTSTSSNAYAYIGQGVHRQAWSDYSSYAFNGGNTRTSKVTGASYPGIAGRKLSSIKDPSRTILVAEMPAFYCFSWHDPQNPKLPHYFQGARNMAAFVDGGVSYIRFYWDSSKPQNESWEYDPPSGYAYKWSGD